ncbi:2-hydroxyacid dehydrogenase [Lentiprolixibacter aurantiacus]|uniref:Glyoxylate/hydroxypyruvate reductase A n=1 Tax=Lentiprolixibacter aurantiacus TaxID=2993939 RepID=A0AAE3MLW3_9FLAO|nr:glyoxylate/hydroxypyruvate reductase A [Lentiprolixibacter aurantiacus]MCX2719588.1 glyoxylate/hydroxypyruvate reductase A [Lentiprolixibacter aurantiacus]
MPIVIIRNDHKTMAWKEALLKADPELEIYAHDEEHDPERITMAIVWKPPHGVLSHYPNLGAIASFGAGVDFLFEENSLPEGVPITRVVDPVLAADMSEFVTAVILAQLKNLLVFKHIQPNKKWLPMEYRRISEVSVGIMGLGELGCRLAVDLVRFGFKVRGWARSEKDIDKVSCFAGEQGLTSFLSGTDLLVCLLPLTPDTRGILNKGLFMKLPEGAYVINVARGGHLEEDDLLEVLEQGHLSGAFLDVFSREPLPEDHPFWQHPKIDMSPHVASVSDVNSVVPQLLDNYYRLQEGQPLKNQVSTSRGY